MSFEEEQKNKEIDAIINGENYMIVDKDYFKQLQDYTDIYNNLLDNIKTDILKIFDSTNSLLIREACSNILKQIKKGVL